MYNNIAPITGNVIATHPLPEHKFAQCEIIHAENPNAIFFKSYSTIVAYYNPNTNTIYERKYSATTSKHQTWFYQYIRDTYNWTCERKIIK